MKSQQSNQWNVGSQASLSPLSPAVFSPCMSIPATSIDSYNLESSEAAPSHSHITSTATPCPARISTASSRSTTDFVDSPIGRKSGQILPLSIPTKHEHLFSGFSYHHDLFDIQVSPKQWERFNEDIQKALKPNSFDRLTARLSNLKVLPIGPIYFTLTSIKAANNRAIEKRILQSLQDDVGENLGELAATMKRWNEEAFAPLGLEVNIQLSSSALKRISKEEKKRKERERKTREKYGTTAYYPPDVEEDEGDTADAGKKYKIVISRLEAPPEYNEFEGQALMLDGTPRGPAEMPDTSTAHISELPAALPVTAKQPDGLQHEGLAELYDDAITL